ncbi:MAG: FKBP-type peptidyl-prolyl cis-trans isomerase [Nitrospirota bacterium]
MNVSVGKVVSVEYTLRIDEEDIVDTNVGADPLIYQHGAQEILPGLEKGLEGMAVGESKRIEVSPAEGYGDVHPEGFFEIAKDRIAPDALRVGAKLQGEAPDGTPVFPRVAEIREETVVLDLNHPLAGKTLYFDVKVLDIKQSS